MKNKMVKVKCNFCSKEITCPEGGHPGKDVCFDCFTSDKLKGMEFKMFHVECSKDKINEAFPFLFVSELVNKTFPIIWKEMKDEIETASKEEIAREMFAVGAGTVINMMSYSDEITKKLKKDTHKSVGM